MTTFNAPQSFELIVGIRSVSQLLTSKDNRGYYKIEVDVFASKLVSDTETTVWEDSNSELMNSTLFKVTPEFKNIWLEGKLETDNILRVKVEVRIANVTQYVDNNTEEILTHTKSSIELVEAIQSNHYDLLRVNKTVDIADLIPIMVANIQSAQRRSASTFKGIVL